MSAPRCVLPAVTYLLTRRCSERRFFLRPSDDVNAILRYCLAYAATRFGVELHAYDFLSNHFHLVATDRHGRLPEFMHCLDLLIARAVNARHGRFEALWATGSYSAVCLTDREAILEKMAYTLANPVAAGLVQTAALWPGVCSRPEDIGAPPRRVPRPRQFFRRTGPQALPAWVELAVVPPPWCDDVPVATLRAEVGQRLARHEAQARQLRQGRPFLGRRRVRRQSVFDRPRDHEPRFGLNPRVAGRDKWRRMEALQRLKGFLDAYRRAWTHWRAGPRELLLFPAGTWKLRREQHVPCEAPS